MYDLTSSLPHAAASNQATYLYGPPQVAALKPALKHQGRVCAPLWLKPWRQARCIGKVKGCCRRLLGRAEALVCAHSCRSTICRTACTTASHQSACPAAAGCHGLRRLDAVSTLGVWGLWLQAVVHQAVDQLVTLLLPLCLPGCNDIWPAAICCWPQRLGPDWRAAAAGVQPGWDHGCAHA